MARRRPSMGRQKIEMKRIENEEARQVCFSKRRTGLFKKASELSILCGAELGVVVFSPAGKVFSFGHPSVEAVVDRFLGAPATPGGGSGTLAAAAAAGPGPLLQGGLKDLNRQFTELSNKLEAEKKKREAADKALKGGVAPQQQRHYWRDVDLEGLGLEELERFRVSLGRLKCSIAKRTETLLLDAATSRRPPPPPPPPPVLQPLPAATVGLADLAGFDAFLLREKGGSILFAGDDYFGLRHGVY